jgi:hypothetical protein
MKQTNEADVAAIADAIVVDWDVPITMDDGTVLRADVFRPVEKGRYPVILSYGPYGKGLAFQEGYPAAWEGMIRSHPDVAKGSSGRYQDCWILGRSERAATSARRLPGPRHSRGATAKSA